MTIQFPEALFRLAEQKAKERGIPVDDFVAQLVEEKLRANPSAKPWMEGFGMLADLHEETERIMRITEEEHEQIEPEMWT